jgi:phage baseplate assembly protein W
MANISPKYFGYNAPFIGGNERVLSRQVDDRLIRNDLLQLLLTAPGERVMRPDFGSPIRAYVFEQIDDTGIDILRERIKETITRFEGRVSVTDVAIETNPDSNLINIKVYGFFKIDRFGQLTGNPDQADLLVELKIPTRKTAPGIS